MKSLLLLLGLAGMGFGLGLSGALIPGPLLAFTITESVKHGSKTGVLVITGHLIVEVLVVFLIIIGFLKFLSSPFLAGTVGIAGAVLLFFEGIFLVRQKNLTIQNVSAGAYGPVLGGIVFTLFNPTFPPWWATVGYNMLWEGMRQAGITGLSFVLAGHWASDFGWYVLVSNMVAGRRTLLLQERVYPALKTIMAAFMFFLGAYFLAGGMKILKIW